MKYIYSFLCLFLLSGVLSADISVKITNPELDKNSWLMIEVWPDVMDVTLTAYFLDYTFDKNKALCKATKRVFDREQEFHQNEVRRKTGNSEFIMNSFRKCLSVNEARSLGYFQH